MCLYVSRLEISHIVSIMVFSVRSGILITQNDKHWWTLATHLILFSLPSSILYDYRLVKIANKRFVLHSIRFFKNIDIPFTIERERETRYFSVQIDIPDKWYSLYTYMHTQIQHMRHASNILLHTYSGTGMKIVRLGWFVLIYTYNKMSVSI